MLSFVVVVVVLFYFLFCFSVLEFQSMKENRVNISNELKLNVDLSLFIFPSRLIGA